MNTTKAIAAHTPSAFDAFYAEGGATPGNAARLAAEDHKAEGLKNWAFIDALREAGKLSDAAPELLALARDFLVLMECSEFRKHTDATRHGSLDYYAKNARAAIAKATT
jgi:hypothetical protein